MRWWRRLELWWLRLRRRWWLGLARLWRSTPPPATLPLVAAPPPSPGLHLAVVDAASADLADAVGQLAPSDHLVVTAPHPAHVADARGAVVLLPVGDRPGEIDRATTYLHALALAHEDADPVPVVVVWCVTASERTDALLGTTGDGVWVNEMGLGRWDAWRRLRARHSSDAAALAAVTTRLRRLLALPTHHDALAGNSERLLSYADRASAGRTFLVPLLASASYPGAWHGHEMLRSALELSFPVAVGIAHPAAPTADQQVPAVVVETGSRTLPGSPAPHVESGAWARVDLGLADKDAHLDSP